MHAERPVLQAARWSAATEGSELQGPANGPGAALTRTASALPVRVWVMS